MFAVKLTPGIKTLQRCLPFHLNKSVKLNDIFLSSRYLLSEIVEVVKKYLFGLYKKVF